MKKLRIKRDNLPLSYGTGFWISIWLLLDRFQADRVWFGVYWCLVVIAAIGTVWAIFDTEDVDVIEELRNLRRK